MFLNTLESLNVFHAAIPNLPMGKYAHVVILRETNSFALFQTDGELNISRVSKGRKVENQDQATRIVLFKRKQSTPERLTGRELLRRYKLDLARHVPHPFALHDDLVNHGAAQLVRVLIRVHTLAGGGGSHRAERSRGIGRIGGHFSH